MKKNRIGSTILMSLLALFCSLLLSTSNAHAADEIGAPRYAPNVYTTNGTIEVDIVNEFYGDNIDGVELFQRYNNGEWTRCVDIPHSDFTDYYYKYTVTPTESGTYEYKHRVYAGSKQGTFSESESVIFLKNPIITNVDATSNKVTVTWEKDPLATSYELTVGPKSFAWYLTTNYTIPGSSNSYTFKYEDYYIGDTVGLSLQSLRDDVRSEETIRTFPLLETPALRADLQTNSSEVHLRWNNVSGALSYDIFRYDEKQKRFVLLDDVGTKITRYIDKNRQPSTNYRYKIQARYQMPLGGKKDIKSNMSNEVSVYTHAQNPSINAKLKTKKSAVKLKNYPGEISDFFDHKGYYTIAYEYGKYIYVRRFNASNLKLKKTIKIKKKYPSVGGVVCDKNGNYYIAWGKYNATENKNKVTFAVSKYSYKGKHIKTAKGDAGLNVKMPFRSGGCAMTIDGNNLVCNFARLMYKASDGLNHQASQVFAVNTKTMKRVDSYYNYVSHSFSQRAITLRNGGVLFADLGDAYPRGFTLNDQKKRQSHSVPFLRSTRKQLHKRIIGRCA